MIEGWYGDDYLIFFEESELSSAETRYNFTTLLPGFQIVGLRGWNDFIVRDSAGHTYSVPTVPIDKRYLETFAVPSEHPNLSPTKNSEEKSNGICSR